MPIGLRRLGIVLASGLVAATATCSDQDVTAPGARSARPLAAVAADTATAVLVGAGNIAKCGKTTQELTAEILDTIPGTVFTAGDNVYAASGVPPDFSCYDPSWGRHKSRTMPAIGSMETWDPSAYYNYFGAVAGTPGQGWYSYNVGAWHIVVLNSNASVAVGSAQDQWLKGDLAANPRMCTAAVWHHPLFSSQAGVNTAMRPLWDALYQAGVELAVTAHSEDYERFAPQHSDGTPDTLYGVREFVVGTGGTGTASFGTILPNSEARFRGGFGVLKLTLHPDGYDWEFVPAAGTSYHDSGHGTCHAASPGANTPPVANPGGPYESEATVTFDGTRSADSDGNLPLTYHWDFGDGASDTGATPTHTYAADSNYAATLTVIDALGAVSAPVSVTVTIHNMPPVIDAGSDSWAWAGDSAVFRTSLHDPGANDGPWSVHVTWGDGTATDARIDAQAAVLAVGHVYGAPGDFAVTVAATDKGGATGSGQALAHVTPRETAFILSGAGNISACYTDRDEATAELLDVLPGAVFTLGDNMIPDGTAAEYRDCYGPTWGRHRNRTSPVLGNHDYGTPGGADAFAYWGPRAGAPGQGWYSYDLGAWHVIVLNDNVPYGTGSAQDQWLAADLAASRKVCTLAMWHTPYFLSSDQPGYTVNSSYQAVWNRLYAAGVELVLNGHRHQYERFAPMNPEGARDDARGIREINVGTGGESVALPTRSIGPNSEVLAAPFGVLELTLTDGGYHWNFVPIPGVAFADSGSGTCHGNENAPPVAVPGGPYTSEGAVSFDGRGSYDPDGNVPLAYAWDFGDGATAVTPTATHTYTSDGVYTARLTVTDALGAAGTATVSVTIANLPPVVSAGPDAAAQAGQGFTLQGSFSDPGAADGPWTWTVDWGDGAGDRGTAATAGKVTPTHIYGAAGTYVARLAVTDTGGATGTDQVNVTVTATAGDPVLVGAGDIGDCNSTGAASTAALLDGIAGTVFTAGDDAYPNGSDADFANCYNPSWGRHKARTTPTPGNHDYNTPGGTGYFNYFGAAAGEAGKGYYSYDLGRWHVVMLNTEIDVSAGSAEEQWLKADLAASPLPCTIAIWHEPRFSSGAAHGSSTRSQALWNDLYAAGAEVVVNGHDHEYERFAPQSPTGAADPAYGIREFVVGTGGAGLYSFATPLPNSEVRNSVTKGVIKFTLKDGGYDWDFVPIAGASFTDHGSGTCHAGPGATNTPPTARPGGPYAAQAAVTFDGSASFDPDGNLPLTYAWTFGDGATGTGVAPTHAYAANGVYTAVLTVTDALGAASAPAAVAVTIANVPPVVAAGPDVTGQLGAAIPLAASFTDAGDAAPWTYRIDWGDGASDAGTLAAEGAVPGSHAYAAPGQYTARVSVTDAHGATGTDEAIVQVNAAAVTLVGAGEIATCAGTHDEATAALLDAIPGTVFTLGDNVATSKTGPDYPNCYGPSWGRHLARTRPAFGNLEKPYPAAYYSYFGAAAGTPGQGYYSYDLGAWHIIVLNSSISLAAGSVQEKWLKADLAASRARCTAAIMNLPLFSSAPGASASVRPAWNDLYAAGAELVLDAHSQIYERFAPQKPDGHPDPAMGIREFTVGTGGLGVMLLGKAMPNSEVRSSGTYGVLKLTLSDTGYAWEFVPVAGQTFTDSGSASCH